MLKGGGHTSRHRLVDLLGRGFWGLADQALVSLTSFLMMVLLARVLSPGDFGAFVLVYGALLFFNALQSGLFTQPHNVLGATRTGDAYLRYTTTTLVTQFAFSFLLTMLAVGAFFVARSVGWESAKLFLAMAPAILAWQTQEYLRRVFYTRGRVGAAFRNDLISYGGQMLLMAIAWQLGWLSGPLAIYVLALTSALAAFAGLWELREELSAKLDRRSIRDNWQFGKWLFGANLVQSGRIQMHVWLIGGLVSVTAAGLYRAAQTLVAPTHIMMNALRSVAMPRAAAIFESEGRTAMQRYLLRVSAMGLAPICLYLLAVCFAAEPLLHAVFSGQYDGYAWLIWIFAIVYLLAYAGQVLTIMLSAMRISRAVLIAEAVTIVVAVAAGAPLIAAFGMGGAMVADVLVGLTLVGVLVLRLQQRARPGFVRAPIIDFIPVEVRSHGD